MPMAAVVVAAMMVVCSGFRVKPSNRGGQGMVQGLYTYGAPGTSSPGVKNPRSRTGCFPGKRFWNIRQGRLGTYLDTVVPLAGVAGLEHAKMDGIELNTSSGTFKTVKCSDDLMDAPTGLPNSSLHESVLYIQEASKVSTLVKNVSNIGLRKSYMQDPKEVARRVAEYGWNLVSTAVDEGDGSVVGGYQVSHLIQHPGSLTCMITFQGSSSIGDWFGNAAIAKKSFCGLSSQVHKGFRDHLRRITGSPIFQSKIKTHLPSCSEVLVTGHSLGGAMAELFTACVAAAPGPGEAGYEDYEKMGWNVGRASLLPTEV